MNPALGRIKRAVRAGIAECAGIDGAAATANRRRSVVGDWNNLNADAFPPLDCALALDEVAISRGVAPPILSALAREMGGMFVPHIDANADEGTVSAMLLQIAEQLGALSGKVAQDLANDGVIDWIEATEELVPLEAMILKARQLMTMLTAIRDNKVEGPKTKRGN